MEELLKQILKEIKKTNRRLKNIEELLSQPDEAEPEDDGKNNTYRTLDGGFHNG